MMEPTAANLRKPLEEPLARVMFALSVAFLLVLAGVFHRHEAFDPDNPELRVQLALLGLLWPAFIVEGVWRLVFRDRSERLWKQLVRFLLICLAPPLRIGVRSLAPDHAVWLPFLGWQEVDRELRRKLERFFSVPMIVVALMVLPLLAIHFGLLAEKQNPAGLSLVLDIGNGLVWFAFVFEFIVMASVAQRKLQYATQHWVNLAIILIPMVQFLPLLRLLRIGNILRLEQLTRMNRLYRLQGLALRAWRALLLLEVVQRLTGQTLEKRLKKLRDLYTAKEEELEELRQEIEDLQKRIAEQKQARAAKEASNP